MGGSGPEMLAARFNGTGMSVSGGIGGGVTDGNTFICSFWVRFRQDNNTQMIFHIRGTDPISGLTYNGFTIWRENDNTLRLVARGPGTTLGQIVHEWTTSRTFTVADGWVHVYAFRGSSEAGVWINNEPHVELIPTTAFIDFTQSAMYFARNYTGANDFAAVADIAEFYLIRNPGVLPTHPSVRDLFVRGTGANCKPVMNRGFSSNWWSLPTPHVYLSADTLQFHINWGLGNSFSSFPADATYVPSGKFYV
jgi:hypothetical protein